MRGERERCRRAREEVAERERKEREREKREREREREREVLREGRLKKHSFCAGSSKGAPSFSGPLRSFFWLSIPVLRGAKTFLFPAAASERINEHSSREKSRVERQRESINNSLLLSHSIEMAASQENESKNEITHGTKIGSFISSFKPSRVRQLSCSRTRWRAATSTAGGGGAREAPSWASSVSSSASSAMAEHGALSCACCSVGAPRCARRAARRPAAAAADCIFKKKRGEREVEAKFCCFGVCVLKFLQN